VARKNRDYKAEYTRRIERGLTQGLSRSQARGHPGPAEPPVTKATAKVGYNVRLEAGFKALKEGKTLTESAKEVRIAPERLRHYLQSQGIGRKVRGRCMAGPDNRKRHMLLYSEGKAAQGVDSLCPLPNQHLPVLDDNRRCLLTTCLHRHGPHGRPRCRLADRFRVIAIVLAALDEGLHVLRGNQLYPVAHSSQNPAPVMGTRTGFQRDLRWGLPGKKGFNLPTPENDAVLLVNAV
jgi:hypothetical protein